MPVVERVDRYIIQGPIKKNRTLQYYSDELNIKFEYMENE